MEVIRAFIAIELPEPVKEALGRILSELKEMDHSPVKWVDPEGIHLTLKFLGNIPDGRVTAITTAYSGASNDASPFRLELNGLGAFPNLRKPRVVWVGMGGDIANLLKLQKNIERALVPLGFPAEKRSFSPHLTLGRVRDRASAPERHSLGEIVASLKAGGTPSFEVSSVSLIRSTLTREGAIYNRLASVALGSGEVL
ncbi:RNA 2',3'-cyclic phosphodiesterase [Chloroflexota bacterium]